MLHPVAELPQHAVGNVGRALGHEVDADPFRADEAHHQFNFFQQRLGGVVEQEMCLIEEEHQHGFIGIPHLGQLLEQLGEQPEQEAGIEPAGLGELAGRQHIDVAVAGPVGLQQILNIQHGLAEEVIPSGALQGEQVAQYGADGGGGHIAIAGGEGFGVVPGKLHHGAQVFQIEQQQALVVRHLEHQLQHPALGVVEAEQAGQQQGPHVGDGGPHRVPLLRKQVPEQGRTGGEGGGRDAELGQPGIQLARRGAGGAEAAEIPLHIRQKDRHPEAGEPLCQHLQGDCLAGPRGTCDEAVAVGHGGQQGDGLAIGIGQRQRLGHGELLVLAGSGKLRATRSVVAEPNDGKAARIAPCG